MGSEHLVSGPRSYLKVAGTLVVAVVLAGSAYVATFASTEAADVTRDTDTAQVPVSNLIAGSPDLADLSSPWLGYTVSLPVTWAFTGHVAPGDSATPHDSFMGVVPGANATMMLVIGRSKDAPARVVDHTIAVEGGTFAVTPAADMGDGAIALIAEATWGGVNWYVMGHMPDSAATRAYFDRLVSSFRFPAAGYDAPSPGE